jgi:hypothetical protein
MNDNELMLYAGSVAALAQNDAYKKAMQAPPPDRDMLGGPREPEMPEMPDFEMPAPAGIDRNTRAARMSRV